MKRKRKAEENMSRKDKAKKRRKGVGEELGGGRGDDGEKARGEGNMRRK